MAGRRTGATGLGRKNPSSWACDTKYLLNISNYQGKVWIKVKLKQWANVPGDAGYSQSDAVIRIHPESYTGCPGADPGTATSCAWNNTPILRKEGGGSGGTDNVSNKYPSKCEWRSDGPMFDSSGGKLPYDLIFKTYVYSPYEATNSKPVVVAKMQIDSYSSSTFDPTTKLNPNPQVYDVILAGNAATYWRLSKGCAGPTNAAGGVNVVVPAGHAPAPVDKYKIYIKVDPSDTWSANDTPVAAGDIVMLNLVKQCSTDKGPGVMECYEVDGPFYTLPADRTDPATVFGDPSNCKVDPVTGCSAYGGNPAIPSAGDTDYPELLRPGDYIMERGWDCEKCNPLGQASELHRENIEILHKLGWTCGFTNSVVKKARFKHVTRNNDGSDAKKPEAVEYDVVMTAAHHKAPVLTLPMGAGTRVSYGGKFNIIKPNTANVYFRKATFKWMIESQIQEKWEVSRVWRGVLRRSLGAGGEESVVDGLNSGAGEEGGIVSPEGRRRPDNRAIDPDDAVHETEAEENAIGIDPASGKAKKESARMLSAGQMGMYFSRQVSKSTNASAGVKIDDLLYASASLNYNETTKTSLNDPLGQYSNTNKSFSLSSQISGAGLGRWLALDADRAITSEGLGGNGGFETWFKDSFSMSFNWGSASKVTATGKDFLCTLDEDGKVNIDDTKFDEWATDSGWTGEFGRLQSVDFSYNIQMWNGWTLDINLPSASIDENDVLDCTQMLKFNQGNYKLTGNPKDPVRWSVGYSAGAIEVAAATRVGILHAEDMDRKRRFEADPAGNGEKWTSESNSIFDFANIDAKKMPTLYFNSSAVFKTSTKVNTPNEVTYSSSLAGAYKGFNYAINTQTGESYIGKAWKHNFAKNFPKFINKELGDSFDLTMSMKSSNSPITGTSFNIGVDLDFKKTVFQMGEVMGRMIVEAKAYARLGIGASGESQGPISGAKFIGFGAVATLRWKNNLLSWFGLPFNIHPGMSAGFACSFNFGGYTKKLENYNESGAIVPSVKVQQQFSYTFSLGQLTFTYELVDSFREHLKARHKSVFQIVGLGDCPVLRVIGPLESVWSYTFRVAPFRALSAVAHAADLCSQVRNKMWTKKYQSFVTTQLAMPTLLKRGITSPKNCLDRIKILISSGKKTSGGAPKGSGNLPDLRNKRWDGQELNPNFKPRPKGWTADQQTDHALLNQQRILNKNMDKKFAPSTVFEPPFPCFCSRRQMIRYTNYQMRIYFDGGQQGDRCWCIKKKFKDLSEDTYYGASGFNFIKWKKELEGTDAGTNEGIVKRGVMVIDNLVLNFILAGKDPTAKKNVIWGATPENPTGELLDSDAVAFKMMLAGSITDIMGSLNLDQAQQDEIWKEFDKNFGDHLKRNKTVSWWEKTNGGICGGIKFLIMGVVDAIRWVGGQSIRLLKGIWKYTIGGLWSLLTGGDDEDASAIEKEKDLASMTLEVASPCGKLQFDSDGEGYYNQSATNLVMTDHCYEYYREFEHYREAYAPWMEFLKRSSFDKTGAVPGTSMGSSNPYAAYVGGTHLGEWVIGFHQRKSNRKAIWGTTQPKWGDHRYVTKLLGLFPSGHGRNDESTLIQTANWTAHNIRDLIKAYCILGGDNLEWVNNNDEAVWGEGTGKDPSATSGGVFRNVDFSSILTPAHGLMQGTALNAQTFCRDSYSYLMGDLNLNRGAMPIEQLGSTEILANPCSRGHKTEGEDELTNHSYWGTDGDVNTRVEEIDEDDPEDQEDGYRDRYFACVKSKAATGGCASAPNNLYSYDELVKWAIQLGEPSNSWVAATYITPMASSILDTLADPELATLLMDKDNTLSKETLGRFWQIGTDYGTWSTAQKGPHVTASNGNSWADIYAKWKDIRDAIKADSGGSFFNPPEKAGTATVTPDILKTFFVKYQAFIDVIEGLAAGGGGLDRPFEIKAIEILGWYKKVIGDFLRGHCFELLIRPAEPHHAPMTAIFLEGFDWASTSGGGKDFTPVVTKNKEMAVQAIFYALTISQGHDPLTTAGHLEGVAKRYSDDWTLDHHGTSASKDGTGLVCPSLAWLFNNDDFFLHEQDFKSCVQDEENTVDAVMMRMKDSLAFRAGLSGWEKISLNGDSETPFKAIGRQGNEVKIMGGKVGVGRGTKISFLYALSLFTGDWANDGKVGAGYWDYVDQVTSLEWYRIVAAKAWTPSKITNTWLDFAWQLAPNGSRATRVMDYQRWIEPTVHSKVYYSIRTFAYGQKK